MKKNMRRVISVLLVLLLVMSMAVTAFAQTNYTFYNIDYSTGEPQQVKSFSIEADEIEKGDLICDDEFNAEYQIYNCKGDVLVDILSDVSFVFNVYDFNIDTFSCSNMYLPEGYNNHDSWTDEEHKAGNYYLLESPGIYMVESLVKDGFAEQLILVVEEDEGDPSINDKPVSEVPKSFSDIPSSHWAHDAIMEMVTMGILKGATLPDANGIATFNAGGQMKYAEFLAVMTRMIYPDVDIDYAGYADEGWYMPFYYAALDMELVFEGEVTKAQLMQPMTREQMARVLVRTGMIIGTVSGEVGYTDFPDIYAVGDEYFESVAMAYGEGLLCGVDSKGTFNPKGTLTRAEAAMVCFRLLDYSARKLPA